MKILFLTQYCPPEVGAPQNRIFEFAKKLKEFGNEVSILKYFAIIELNRSNSDEK